MFLRPADSRKQADESKAQFAHKDGDHLSLLNVYHAYKESKLTGVISFFSLSILIQLCYCFYSDEGDPQWCYNNFLNGRSLKAADNIRTQLSRSMTRAGLPLVSRPFEDPKYYPMIRKALLSGFFMQVAKHDKGGSYQTVKDNQIVHIHPSSCLDSNPDWVMYNEFVLTSRNYIRTVTEVKGDW